METHHTSTVGTDKLAFFDFSVGPIWRSPVLRNQWERNLGLAARAWLAIERYSVPAGVRSSCLLIITAPELPALSQWADSLGLGLSVLGPEPVSRNGYSVAAVSGPADDGYRVAIHREGLGPLWHQAWSTRDDEVIGQLLGFPQCCRDAFKESWIEQGLRDPALGAAKREGIEGPAACNTLLKPLSIRAVPHLPCSFSCTGSAALGEALLHVGARIDNTGAFFLRELLGSSMTFTALHGIGEVTSPVFKLCFGTDQGIGTFSRKAVAPPSHVDNGFTSAEAMASAHQAIIAAVSRARQRSCVVDLGCGDGALLTALRAAGLGIERTIGIEALAPKVTRGLQLHPDNTLRVGTISEFDLDPGTDLLLIAAQRMVEMTTTEHAAFGKVLQRCQAVIYSYAGRLKDMIEVDPGSIVSDGTTDVHLTEWRDD